MRLAPVLASAARALGLVVVLRSDFDLTEQERIEGKFGSDWVLLARRAEDLGALAADPRWWVPEVPEGSALSPGVDT